MDRIIIKMKGDGNCLFRAASYFIYNTEDRHRKIRLDTVSKIVNDWDFYKDFMVLSVEEYKNLLSLDGEYGGSIELTCISNLYPDYLFRVHYVNSTNTVDYGVGSIVCNLLFSGDYDEGHFDVILNTPVSRNIEYHSTKKYKRKKSLTGRREAIAKRRCYQNKRPFEAHYKCAVLNSGLELVPHNIGTLSYACKYCNALYFLCEKNTLGKFNLCCSEGKISLPFSDMPAKIKKLYIDNTDKSKNFRANIRQYNNALSFVSFGADVKVPPGNGPYCFKILGMVHHRISSLYPEKLNDSAYGQLYILDFSEANQIRLKHPSNTKLREDVLNLLNEELKKCNPYIRSYMTMQEKLKKQKQLALEQNRPEINLVMRFYHDPQSDPRRYNGPSSSEIAAIFESSDGAPPSNRHISVYPKKGGLTKIDYDSMHCDPMCYVLIWPKGETGWHISMPTGGDRKTITRHNATMREYVSYRLAIRGKSPLGNFNPLLNAGQLTQQLIVDYYCRIEGDRLKFIRNQQTKLRVDTYVGLADAIQTKADNEKLKAGRIVILPSSFNGSPRNMMQNYQDAMAIVRKFGKPDIFITFTCNPLWPEIVNSINSYETVNNRPDIVVRVFQSKVKELLRLITVKQIFGDVQTLIYTVEFQKRGLPHIHLLLCLKEHCKLREIKDIDNVVSAEIPDPNDTNLFNLVKSHMVHGPCGHLNPNSVCMDKGKCKKEYPKAFVPETKENVNGYPLYRRRNNGRTFSKLINRVKIDIDNRFIVPYNAFLLKYFQAHINVEICASVHSVKYLHKYVYKGHDCANIQITADNNVLHHDEVSTFLNTRYVGPTEAAYRIFAYPMHEQSHTIIRLPVHLPNEQQVYFNTDNASEALLKATLKNTKLIAWFELNKNPVSKSPYVYPETPVHYVWNETTNQWNKRVKFGKIIGRLYNVAPSETERYHLRLLLLHVTGATSFADIRTYKGIIYSTFKEAAMQRGLLLDDSEWTRCLQEASVCQMPFQMRQLFSYICIFQHPNNALHLWNTFRNSISEDYMFFYEDNVSYQLALRDINNIFNQHSISISAFNLPIIDNFPIIPNLHSPTNNNFTPVSKPNEEQKIIIDHIISIVKQNNTNVCNAYFIDGPGGTGKTFVYKYLMHKCSELGFEVISVAWTGIAAMLLPNGRTVHSRFKLPLRLTETSVSYLKLNSKEAKSIKLARLIIWDEAPMANIHALMCINRLLKDIMENDIPFGGKIIILGGDFRQVLPVVPHASRQTIIQNCIKLSPLWPLFKLFTLSINMRTKQNELEFAEFLLKIGNGEYPSVNNEEVDLIELPSTIIAENDIVSEIYGNKFNSSDEIINFAKVAILAPKNEHCNKINSKVLDIIPGTLRSYVSCNYLITEEENEVLQYPTEFLNSLELSGLPPHNLDLKSGAIVILLRNLNASEGLLNGTRLIVHNMYDNCLDLEIITGKNAGHRVLLCRLDLTPSDASLPFSFKRRQFPIRLAFCLTINKAQGQTFDQVGLYLPQPVFSHGQLYVAMSRARSFENLKVEIEPKGKITANVVFKEIL